jgi:hypothetical protein
MSHVGRPIFSAKTLGPLGQDPWLTLLVPRYRVDIIYSLYLLSTEICFYFDISRVL